MKWSWSAWPVSRRAILMVGGAVAALGGLGAVFTVTAVADTRGEPAALATKATLKVAKGRSVRTFAATPQAKRLGALKGAAFEPGKKLGRRAKLGRGEEIVAALTGSLVPVAVESTGGEQVVYSSWRQLAKIVHGAKGQGMSVGQVVGVPSIRAFDSLTGRHRLIARGAHAPALSKSGQLAFMKGDRAAVRHNRPYVGKLMVGAVGGARFEAWTAVSDRYIPYAWAGDTLLAYKAVPDSEATDLYAFTGPNQSRLLAPAAFVVAVSPDGKRALITVARRMVEVIRVADGAVESSMALDGGVVADPNSRTTPHFLMYSGSWQGDRVVANSDVGLAVLNVANGIRIESVFATPPFAHGIVEPTFVDDSHVVGWANLAGRARRLAKRGEPVWDNALVSCDLAAATCAVGAATSGRTWARWVGNPSR